LMSETMRARHNVSHVQGMEAVARILIEGLANHAAWISSR
jgi:hypothetical protein